jgi:hypothetical protein
VGTIDALLKSGTRQQVLELAPESITPKIWKTSAEPIYRGVSHMGADTSFTQRLTHGRAFKNSADPVFDCRVG